MLPDNTGRRELLGLALEHATAMHSLILRLAPSMPTLTAVSRRELDELRSLVVAGDASDDVCAQAMAHLARLDSALSLAVLSGAETAHAVADCIALLEEFELDGVVDRISATRAAALGDQLAEFGALR